MIRNIERQTAAVEQIYKSGNVDLLRGALAALDGHLGEIAWARQSRIAGEEVRHIGLESRKIGGGEELDLITDMRFSEVKMGSVVDIVVNKEAHIKLIRHAKECERLTGESLERVLVVQPGQLQVTSINPSVRNQIEKAVAKLYSMQSNGLLSIKEIDPIPRPLFNFE